MSEPRIIDALSDDYAHLRRREEERKALETERDEAIEDAVRLAKVLVPIFKYLASDPNQIAVPDHCVAEAGTLLTFLSTAVKDRL